MCRQRKIFMYDLLDLLGHENGVALIRYVLYLPVNGSKYKKIIL